MINSKKKKLLRFFVLFNIGSDRLNNLENDDDNNQSKFHS
jgi:hypothetical protein